MIAIIDYKGGNVLSVRNALNRLGYEGIVTDDHETIRQAEKVILPGVGEASTAMGRLKHKGLDELIVTLTQPVLGICLGLQLMCSYSEENDTQCLGIFETRVLRFPESARVPHMGWNTLYNLKGPLFSNIKENEDVYFVHSYYAGLSVETTALTEYILPFSAALQKGNFYATQFHPEKSAGTGEKILKNFIDL